MAENKNDLNRKKNLKPEVEAIERILLFPDIPTEEWADAVSYFNRLWKISKKELIEGRNLKSPLEIEVSAGIQSNFEAIYPTMKKVPGLSMDIRDVRVNLQANLADCNDMIVSLLDSGEKGWEFFSLLEILTRGFLTTDLNCLLSYERVTGKQSESFLTSSLEYLSNFWIEDVYDTFGRRNQEILKLTDSPSIVGRDGEVSKFHNIPLEATEQYDRIWDRYEYPILEHQKKFRHIFGEFMRSRKVVQSALYHSRRADIQDMFLFNADFTTFKNGLCLPEQGAQFVANLIHQSCLTGTIRFRTKSIRQISGGELRAPSQLFRNYTAEAAHIFESSSCGRFVELKFPRSRLISKAG